MSFFQKHQGFFHSICSKIISKSSFSYLIILKSSTPAFIPKRKSSGVFVKRLSVVLLFMYFILQPVKYQSKSHSANDHRHDKMRDSSDSTPPTKMLRRSDSPDNKHSDGTGHSQAKALHVHRPRERDSGKNMSEKMFNMQMVNVIYMLFLIPQNLTILFISR